METTTFTPGQSETQPVQPRTPEAASSHALVMERFLRDRNDVWQQIKQEYRLNELLWQMALSSTVSLACYGLVIGISHSLLQALSSAVKLPILFMLTLFICQPTLYAFNLLYGGRLSVRQVMALLLSAITVTSGLMLTFAPITIFFLLTSHSYPFFVLLNVAIMALTGTIGLQFLVNGTQMLNALAHEEHTPSADTSGITPARQAASSTNMKLIYLWLVVYSFVGTQLGWT